MEKQNLAKIAEPTEVVFSFDTTSSMSPAIQAVRQQIEKTCDDWFTNIPNLKVGLIAHGDYCDGENCYNILPLTDDRDKIYDFIRHTPNTSGGDAPECYELALNLAKRMGWSDGIGKILVMIGDAEPHPTDYPGNTDKLDWRKELADLKEMGVNVYALECLGGCKFWSEMAELAGTPRMRLDEFCDASATLEAFAYAAAGEEHFAAYEKRIADAGVVRSVNLCSNIGTLKTEAMTKYTRTNEKE